MEGRLWAGGGEGDLNAMVSEQCGLWQCGLSVAVPQCHSGLVGLVEVPLNECMEVHGCCYRRGALQHEAYIWGMQGHAGAWKVPGMATQVPGITTGDAGVP